MSFLLFAIWGGEVLVKKFEEHCLMGRTDFQILKVGKTVTKTNTFISLLLVSAFLCFPKMTTWIIR